MIGGIWKVKNGVSLVNGSINSSPCWADFLKIKQLYTNKGRIMMIGNGQQTNFWGDTWCIDKPLKDQYPDLLQFAMIQTALLNS